MTERKVDMQYWWAWFDRVDAKVRSNDEIVRNSERALERSLSHDTRRAVVDEIFGQIHALENDAIAAERLALRLGPSRASAALTSVATKLDRLSSRLCGLVIDERT